MGVRFLLRCVLAGWGALVASMVAGDSVAAEPSLKAQLNAALGRGALKGARVGLMAVELQTGETVVAHNSDELLTPASLVKLFTTATALHELTPQHTWRTELLGVGKLKQGVYKGTLYLKGSGDPALVSERLWLLADALKRRGLFRVEGDLVVDDSYFDLERHGRGWGPISGAWYHAPIGALSFNHNAVLRGGRYRAISGDPALHTGRALLKTLAALGIEVQGELRRGQTPEHARVLEVSTSRPLGALVADVNKFSNNFMAEQLLKTLGARAHGPPGTTEGGLTVVSAFLATLGIEPGSYRLQGGSGLGKQNRISAAQVVRLLLAMARDFETAPEFRASLKVAGAEGENGRFKDPLCHRNMRVKTGHLRGVNALAGYARDRHGRELAFAVIANGLTTGRVTADRALERLCELFLARPAPESVGEADRSPAPDGEPG
jgi:D-alanyl-D-alanine carboxypeptidase/D-alanyl-D-alanine-endopeptidase (penicillin-binding protein 4)